MMKKKNKKLTHTQKLSITFTKPEGYIEIPDSPLPDGLINPASFKDDSFRVTKDGKWVTFSLAKMRKKIKKWWKEVKSGKRNGIGV